MALDWIPIYPDLLPRPRRIPVGGQAVLDAVPIPNPAPPTDQPPPSVFPDSLVSPRRLRLGFSVRPLIDFTSAEMRWAPSYPAILPRRRLPVAAMPSFAFPWSAQTSIATLRWQPTFPAQLRRPTRQTPSGSTPFIVPMSVLLEAGECLKIVTVAFTDAEITGGATTSAAITESAPTTARITGESACSDGFLGITDATFGTTEILTVDAVTILSSDGQPLFART